MKYLMPLLAVAVAAGPLCAQPKAPQLSDAEQVINDHLHSLRNVPDSERGAVTRRLAVQIREIPLAEGRRLRLANGLANLATEGDYGHETLQEVATTLAGALRETAAQFRGASDFAELAQLVRYEHVDAKLDMPEFRAAMAKLEDEDRRRQDADFTLTDLHGQSWTLKALRGKVVLVNFWATWCPPCRKEMPDLETLYHRFQDRGLVILGISDETAAKVESFTAENKYTYPMLVDPGRKVNEMFAVQGIPKTFIYDREGRLAAQAIDMRTMNQFLAMLDKAGIR